MGARRFVIGAFVPLLWSRHALAGGGAATDAYDDINQGPPVDVRALLDVYSNTTRTDLLPA